MSNGATSQKELVASSDGPVAGGSSFSPAPTPELVDVEARIKDVAVILPARLSTTRARGMCTSYRAAAEATTAAAVAIRHRRR